jgi:Ni,Fe-hydrogenase III large subunit
VSRPACQRAAASAEQAVEVFARHAHGLQHGAQLVAFFGGDRLSARASGVSVDARRQHPLSGVEFPQTTHTQTGGDVLARFMVRAEKITASIQFITREVRWLDGYRGTAPTELSPAPGELRSGVGGWRGTIVHRVEVAAEGQLTRVKVVDPSFFNWPALPVALADTIVLDFPLTNKSFNLSYAGNDL